MSNVFSFPTDAVTVPEGTPVSEAAKLMRERSVGSVLVHKPDDPRRLPTGILTDRDIVVRAVAAGADVGKITVESIMSQPVICGRYGQDPMTLLERMRKHGVRRLAMLNYEGGLGGIASLDDLWTHLGEQFGAVIGIVGHEQLRERLGVSAGPDDEFRREPINP